MISLPLTIISQILPLILRMGSYFIKQMVCINSQINQIWIVITEIEYVSTLGSCLTKQYTIKPVAVG